MDVLDIVKYIVDIAIVGYIFYKIIMVLQGTKAVQIIKGTALIVGVWIFSGLFGLQTLKFILSQVIIYGILGLIIIFQPELRDALEKLGRRNIFSKSEKEKGIEERNISDIVDAVEYMSKRRIGALMSIEIEESLDEYIVTGIPLGAEISKELIMNIFTPNVPLHDGAVIIKDGKIEAASCYLPLSESTNIPKELGTRHRAAIGLSEQSDALTLIVSEETGGISLTKNKKIYRNLGLDELRNHLEMILLKENDDEDKSKSKSKNKTPWIKRRGWK